MHYKNFKFYYFIEKYDLDLINNLPKNVSLIYRNYDKKINKQEIFNIKKICRRKKYNLYLANNIKIAIELGLDGAYLPSFNKSTQHNSFSLKKKFELLGSSHNLKEIKEKELQKVDNIFLSPVFKTKNYKNWLGIYKLNSLMRFTSKKITCLGGINEKNMKKLKLLNIHYIAGIKLFEKYLIKK